jgi:hypothetical protein
MLYVLILLSVFIISFVIGGYLLRDGNMSSGAFVTWVLLFASASTFLFGNIW